MVILPSGVINVLWLIVWGAEFVQPSPPAAAQFMQTSFFPDLGRYRPCSPCPREVPSLPPSVDLRNVLFSTSAWMFATWPPQWGKKGGQSVYQRSLEWGQDLLHVFVTCWKTNIKQPGHLLPNYFRVQAALRWKSESGLRSKMVFGTDLFSWLRWYVWK